jgi:hypothetical protein
LRSSRRSSIGCSRVVLLTRSSGCRTRRLPYRASSQAASGAAHARRTKSNTQQSCWCTRSTDAARIAALKRNNCMTALATGSSQHPGARPLAVWERSCFGRPSPDVDERGSAVYVGTHLRSPLNSLIRVGQCAPALLGESDRPPRRRPASRRTTPLSPLRSPVLRRREHECDRASG